MDHIPRYRHSLNQEQVDVLELLYKFRFASSELIARHCGKKSGVFVYKRLKILQEQGFIGKRFDSSYRLQGKPAAYYLLPKGARKLQVHREDLNINITLLYKEKTVSEAFAQHYIDILAVYIQLQQLYGGKLKLFTKSQLREYEYFPKPLPDAYLSLKSGNEPKRFFFELIENSTPFFVVDKKIKKYIAYFENGAWDDTGSDFPGILLLCETPALQKWVQKRVATNLNNADVDDLLFATAAKNILLKSTGSSSIWQTADEPNNRLPLHAF
jgi:hypothetical protein